MYHAKANHVTNTIMKKLFLVAFLISPFVIFAQKIINDPNAEVRTVGSFNAIKVSNAIDLYLTQGTENAVAVSAKTAEFRANIKTTIENGTLKISYDDGSKFWKNSGNKKLRAYVSVATLTSLTASGASDVQIDGVLKAGDLHVHLSGASDMKGSIDAVALNFDINGASDATISGTAVNLKIEASGASDFKGFGLETDHCSAQANGASDIQVTVNKELNAQASGASGVYYKGNGVIRDIKTSGASSVSKRG